MTATTDPTTKLRKIGNSLGITIPKDLLEAIGAQEGDTVALRHENGSLRIEIVNPEFETLVAAYREGNAKYRNALRELSR